MTQEPSQLDFLQAHNDALEKDLTSIRTRSEALLRAAEYLLVCDLRLLEDDPPPGAKKPWGELREAIAAFKGEAAKS